MWHGSRLIRRVNRKIGNPLEWTSCSKAMLLAGVTFLMFLHYAAWAEFLLYSGAASQWINQTYLHSQLPIFYGLSLISLAQLFAFPFFKKAFRDHIGFEYTATLYFAVSLCYFGYQIGTLSMPVGAVLLGAPIVGFILFNRLAVALAMLVALVLLFILSVGAAQGWWAYGPIYSASLFANGQPPLFIVYEFYFYSIPQMVSLIGVSYLVLHRWRDREERVRHLSVTDPLTGLFNRRSILAHLEHEQERSRKKGPALSLLMVDLDRFKTINDDMGHEAGDYALIAAADALQQSLRQNDRVGRYGGEEFLIILPGTDLAGAKMIAERCRQLLESAEVLLQDGQRLTLTASFGLVCNEGNVQLDVDQLLRRADKAMYQAKQQGRNQVVVADW